MVSAQPQHAQNPAFVVGPGAVGLFLGWDLEVPRIQGFLGRSPLPERVVLTTPLTPGEVHFAPVGTTLRDATRLLSRNPGEPLTFFFCTPPECTHAAVAALAERCVAANRKDVAWVFCSNGIVGEATKSLLRGAGKDHWSLARALIYAGCTRIRQGMEVRVAHAGGTRISYAWLDGPERRKKISGKLLSWEESPNIQSEEAEKLFVNLALANVAGARHMTNGEALSHLERLGPFATRFSRCFTERNLGAGELLSRARETAERTSANVNSVSLAWSRGNRAPLDALLLALEQLPLGQEAVAEFWNGLSPELRGG